MNEINFKDISIIKSGGALANTLGKSNKSEFQTVKGTINDINHGTVTKLNTSKKSLKNTSKQAIEHKAPFYPSSTQMSTKNTSWKKSIAESNMVPYENDRATLYSTWTPLSDQKSNQKLFDERKQLCLKWFETWSDSQRSIAIEDILYSCKPKQLFYTRDILNKISPVYHLDFTRILPRVVCLYIMSYLDPRSLSRCSQVCWYWKMLTETDQLWMPKCLRFGWNLNYIPSSFESGIWKQFYIENIKALQYIPLAKVNTPAVTERSEMTLKDISNGKFGFSRFAKSSQKMQRSYKAAGNLKQPPWRANNSNPNHLYRYNYLDGASEETQNKKNNIVKTMKAMTLDNIRNGTSNFSEDQMNNPSADDPNQQIIENLLNKGNTLINQLKAKHEKDQIHEKYEKSFQLPNFAEDDISLQAQADILAKHRQALVQNLEASLPPKNADLQSKKQAWTLLES